MDINQLKEKLRVTNSKIARINSERSEKLGIKSTLSDQLNELIASYNDKYGTSLTRESIQSELEAVKASSIEDVSRMEKVINAIDAGEISIANRLLGLEDEKLESVTDLISGGTESSGEDVVHVEEVETLDSSMTEDPVSPVKPAFSSVEKSVAPPPVKPKPLVSPNRGTVESPSIGNTYKPKTVSPSILEQSQAQKDSPFGETTPPPVVKPPAPPAAPKAEENTGNPNFSTLGALDGFKPAVDEGKKDPTDFKNILGDDFLGGIKD